MPAVKQEPPKSPDFFSRTPGAPRNVFSKFTPKMPYLTSAVSFSTSGHQAVHRLQSKSQSVLSLHPPSMALLAGSFFGFFLIYFFPFLNQPLLEEGRGIIKH